MSPGDLVQPQVRDALVDWSDAKVTVDRLVNLLDRGSALAIATEKWARGGIWIITKLDEDYPARLKERLGENAPPLFFGTGNRDLLSMGGLAVVGSRNASEQDLDFSRALGRAAAEQGLTLVSGCARGVDESAMLGALEVDGTAIGVLGHGLLQAVTSSTLRPHLSNRNLVLLSPYYPEAGFNAGNLMQRNKYIYCLSDAALVVHSGPNGGTWSGAVECLKNNWVPLWVKRTTDNEAGNRGIVAKGARWFDEDPSNVQIRKLLAVQVPPVETGDLFAYSEPGGDESGNRSANEAAAGAYTGGTGLAADVDFYDLFLAKLAALCSESPQSQTVLADRMGLGTSQFKTWAARAEADGVIVKKSQRPVRFEWVGNGNPRMDKN
jgi:predicted Rossmann fold nucleotide-binding protein DprA/Smf involved in DNA uptake